MTKQLTRYQRLRLKASVGQLISSLESMTTWDQYENDGLFPGLISQTYPCVGRRFPKLTRFLDSAKTTKSVDIVNLGSAGIAILGCRSNAILAVSSLANATTHTFNRVRQGAEIDSFLQKELAKYKQITFISHSIGSLMLAERMDTWEPSLLQKCRVWLIDPTDSTLLALSRSDPVANERVIHALWNDIITSLSGTNALDSRMTSDVNFRTSVELKYANTLRRFGTARAALREFHRLRDARIDTGSLAGFVEGVISSERHSQNGSTYVKMQRDLATALGATWSVVEKASHISIIGEQSSANGVADIIWSGDND